MKITRQNERSVGNGPAEWFTGTVRIEPLFNPDHPDRAQGASVTFEPGARTVWHTHPHGQVLIVTNGAGRVQLWGEEIKTIETGDVVCIAPGEKHWHGAAPATSMTHIAVHEVAEGKSVNWLEPVTDTQYGQS